MPLSFFRFLRSDYRDHTLYDFSNVVKAKLFVFELNNDRSVKECVDILPFQINPRNYHRISDSIHGRDPEQLDINGIDMLSYSSHDYDNSGIGIRELNFNIFDEYMARTMNGTLPIPININEITIIDKLFKYANRNYVVVFQWADKYVLRIKKVECTYTSFSKYGEPLSADVEVTFANEYNYQELLKNSYVTSDKIADVAKVTAVSSLEEASSDFLPSIVSSIRERKNKSN